MPGVEGMIKRSPMDGRAGRARMWTAMRVLRTFSVPEVVATAEVSVTAAHKYLRALERAGYLQVAREKQNGRTGGHVLYRLSRDTGPYAPRLGKDGVRDPNLGQAPREPTVTIPKSEYERALACVRACAGMADPEREVAELRRRACS